LCKKKGKKTTFFRKSSQSTKGRLYRPGKERSRTTQRVTIKLVNGGSADIQKSLSQNRGRGEGILETRFNPGETQGSMTGVTFRKVSGRPANSEGGEWREEGRKGEAVLVRHL